MASPSSASVKSFQVFQNADGLQDTLQAFHAMCHCVNVIPNVDIPHHLYNSLRQHYHSAWPTVDFFNALDRYRKQVVYDLVSGSGGLPLMRTLVIGAGPCGLRMAIEFACLGLPCVVLEKRTEFTRKNVLFLRKFVTDDFDRLCGRKFFNTFHTRPHKSIRKLQCIILKVALIMGVQVFTGVTFNGLCEPSCETEKRNWRVNVSPENTLINTYEFDVLIGADGRRSSMPGFERIINKRPQAIAITGNFQLCNDMDEKCLAEIPGRSRAFHQEYFRTLAEVTGVDLENLTYYRDETNYFIATVTKESLWKNGVIRHLDCPSCDLLKAENVDNQALLSMLIRIANYCTNYELDHGEGLQVCLRNGSEPDVSIFDFATLRKCANSCRILHRNGRSVMIALVGDSLYEPFWPEGTGFANGFMHVYDTAWAVRLWASGHHSILDVVSEKERLYALSTVGSGELKSGEMHDGSSFTIDPATRYRSYKWRSSEGDSSPRSKYSTLIDTDASEMSENVQSLSPYLDVLLWYRVRLSHYTEAWRSLLDLGPSWIDGKLLLCLLHCFVPQFVNLSEVDTLSVSRRWELATDLLHRHLNVATPHISPHNIAIFTSEHSKILSDWLVSLYHILQSCPPRRECHPPLSVKETMRTPSEGGAQIPHKTHVRPTTRSKWMEESMKRPSQVMRQSPYCVSDYRQKDMVQCRVCGKDDVSRIDRIILNNGGHTVHRQCLQCAQCRLVLMAHDAKPHLDPDTRKLQLFCRNHVPRNAEVKRLEMPRIWTQSYGDLTDAHLQSTILFSAASYAGDLNANFTSHSKASSDEANAIRSTSISLECLSRGKDDNDLQKVLECRLPSPFEWNDALQRSRAIGRNNTAPSQKLDTFGGALIEPTSLQETLFSNEASFIHTSALSLEQQKNHTPVPREMPFHLDPLRCSSSESSMTEAFPWKSPKSISPNLLLPPAENSTVPQKVPPVVWFSDFEPLEETEVQLQRSAAPLPQPRVVTKSHSRGVTSGLKSVKKTISNLVGRFRKGASSKAAEKSHVIDEEEKKMMEPRRVKLTSFACKRTDSKEQNERQRQFQVRNNVRRSVRLLHQRQVNCVHPNNDTPEPINEMSIRDSSSKNTDEVKAAIHQVREEDESVICERRGNLTMQLNELTARLEFLATCKIALMTTRHTVSELASVQLEERHVQGQMQKLQLQLAENKVEFEQCRVLEELRLIQLLPRSPEDALNEEALLCAYLHIVEERATLAALLDDLQRTITQSEEDAHQAKAKSLRRVVPDRFGTARESGLI